MKNNRLLALAMAGAMLAGSFAAATPVLAENSGTTTLNLKIVDPTYDLVIPSKLDLMGSGYTAFTDGVVIKNLENGTNVTSIDVTAASDTNNWNLVDSKENKISYKLVADAAQTTEKTTYSFTDTSAMASEEGSAIACGVNVSDTDYINATAGDYSDTITWTAEVQKKKTTLKDLLVDGAVVEMEFKYNTHTYYDKVVFSDGEAKIAGLKVDDVSYDSGEWNWYTGINDNIFYVLAENGVPGGLDSSGNNDINVLGKGYCINVNTLSDKYYAETTMPTSSGVTADVTLTSFKVNGKDYSLTGVSTYKDLN